MHKHAHALLDALAHERRLLSRVCQKANFIFIYLALSKESAKGR